MNGLKFLRAALTPFKASANALTTWGTPFSIPHFINGNNTFLKASLRYFPTISESSLKAFDKL